MIDPVPKAIAEKNKAKNFRRSKPPDFAQAEVHLNRAIAMLEAVPLDRPPLPLGKLEKSVATELADCLGSLGGTYRALGKPKLAWECYRRGLVYESDARLPANSYNLVNCLLARLALSPAEEVEVEHISGSFGEQLRATRREIARQAQGPRKSDMWVRADGLVLALLAGDPAARKMWEEFDRLAILEHAYTTTRDVLQDLSGRQTLQPDQRAAIRESLGWFEDAMQRKAWLKAG